MGFFGGGFETGGGDWWKSYFRDFYDSYLICQHLFIVGWTS
jgi:hypothetical protein